MPVFILPAVMRKGLISLSHLMRILAFFNASAVIIGCVHNFGRQSFLHGTLAALARKSHQPAQAQGLTPVGTYFDRHLIVGASYTAGLVSTIGMIFSKA